MTARRLTIAVLSGLALLFASIFIFQPASAQRDPGRLKPPFKLHQIDKTQPMFGVPPLPLNAPIIISETFDSGYVARSNFNTSDPTKWHQVNYSGQFESYTWGQVSGEPVTDTVWVAKSNVPTSPTLAAGTPYTINMNSLLIYGPLNLSDYSTLIVSATYFLDVAPEDSYGLAYSLDGSNFTAVSNEVGSDPTLSARRTSYYNLPAVARQGQVWLAFYFSSSNHPINALGVFLDEVVVRGLPLYKLYLPVVRFDHTPTPTVTPTPTITPTPATTYLYNYSFGTGTNVNNQDFVDWGREVTDGACFYGSGGSSCLWRQNLQTGGNPDGNLMIYQNGLYSWAGASPDNVAPTNFEYSVDFFVVEPKKNARFGLIFGASLSAFGRDENGVPFFDPNRNLYKFDLQFDEVTETIIRYYRLEACQTDVQACAQPVGKTIIPTGYANNVGGWNNLRVRREGSNIKVYLNNNLLVNVTDSTHVGSKKYGVFLQSKDYNSVSNPLKIRIDNVRITTLP